MMKVSSLAAGLLLAAAAALGLAASARADFSLTLPEFDGGYFDPTAPLPPPVAVGLFHYTIPADEVVTGAEIFGTFGDSTVPNSAPVNLFLDGLPVGQNPENGPGTLNTVPWAYTFTPAELPVLAVGPAAFTAAQTDKFVIRLGPTHLEIQTASATPEPGSLALLATGGLGLGFFRLRSRASAPTLREFPPFGG